MSGSGNAVPSKEFVDLEQNMLNADKFVNSTELKFTNRTSPNGNVETKTIAGLEKDVNDAIENTIAKSNIGVWTQGVTTFNSLNEYSEFNGVAYKPKSGITLPYVAQTTSPLTPPDSDNVEPFSDINTSNLGAYADYSFDTVVDLQSAGYLSIGDKVSITERGENYKFIVENGTPNGMNKIDLGGGIIARLLFGFGLAVSPVAYGAVFDDSSDTGPFINAMLTDGVSVAVPHSKGVIDTQVEILDESSIIFIGSRLRTTQPVIAMFNASSVDKWSITGSAILTGTASAPESAQIGIRSIGCLNYRVENVVSEKMLGHGFLIGSDGVISNRGEHGQWSNCAAYESRTGWEFEDGTSSEYTVLTGCSALLNVTGVKNGAGNTNWNGGNIVDNTIGIELYGGSNDNHGIFSGVNINHNTQRNLLADGVGNGYTFDGCHFYANGPASGGTSRILMTNSKQFNFNGGTLACSVQIDKGAATLNGTNVFKDMYVNVDSWAEFLGDDLVNLVSKGHWSDTGYRQDLHYPLPSLITSFQNGWTNTVSSSNDLRYVLNESTNTVTLYGEITGGTSAFATTIAQLNTKYAPQHVVDFVVDSGPKNAGTVSFVQVDNLGQLVWRSGDATRVSVDGISWPIVG